MTGVLRPFLARLAMTAAALLLILAALLVACGFFAFALYLLATSYMPAPLAALATGVAILLLALVPLMLMRRRPSGPKRDLFEDPALEACKKAADIGATFGSQILGFAKAHRNSSLYAALAAGFALGFSPKLRAFLRHLLKP